MRKGHLNTKHKYQVCTEGLDLFLSCVTECPTYCFCLHKVVVFFTPFQPFPVERLVEVTSSIPQASFSPAERPLTAFGRSSVLMRVPHHSQQSVQQRQYSSAPATVQRYNAPPPPFSNQRPASGHSNIVRYAVQEPELCKLDPEAAVLVRGLMRLLHLCFTSHEK